ncbi:hypothetical protein [Streptomyces sp. NPDC054849]
MGAEAPCPPPEGVVVTALDAPQFGPEPGQRAPPFGVVSLPGGFGSGEDLLILGGPGLRHGLDELLFVARGGRVGDPHGGTSAEVGHLLGGPLQLFAG